MIKSTEIKKSKLLNYRVFVAKIHRLSEMGRMFPQEKEKFEQKAKKCRDIMKKIEESIAAIDDGILSEILFQKYVLGRSLETISYAVNYSKRQIERLHLAALERLKI